MRELVLMTLGSIGRGMRRVFIKSEQKCDEFRTLKRYRSSNRKENEMQVNVCARGFSLFALTQLHIAAPQNLGCASD
jgi:hypothetical protein